MASREGFNLFNHHGRRALWSRIWWSFHYRRMGIPWEYLWKDTLGRHVCRITGHTKETFPGEDSYGNQVRICYRCCRQVKP